jgi:hypothetical protein
MKLKSIEQEAADCRAAFAGVPVGTLVWHRHTNASLTEPLTEPAEGSPHRDVTDNTRRRSTSDTTTRP